MFLCTMGRQSSSTLDRRRDPGVTLQALFDAHHGALLRAIRRRGVRPDDVEDIALEVWIDVHRRLPEEREEFASIDEPATLLARTRAWVMTFGRLRTLRWLRDRARDRVTVGPVALDDVIDDRDDLDATLAQRANHALVRRAFAAVKDPSLRRLLEEVHLAGVSQADAARERGWNESRLRRALRRAEHALARELRRARAQPVAAEAR